MRKSEYGSPFFAQDSGRATNDPENQKKMAKILENYRFFSRSPLFFT